MRPRQISLLLFVLWGTASLSGVKVEPDLRRIDPAVLFRENAPGMAAPRVTSDREAAQGLPLSVFIRLAADDDALPEQVRNLGGTARKIQSRIYAARLPADTTRYLSNRPAVLYIEPDRLARPLLDVSRPAVSADLVHQGSPPLPQSFLGENTFVGIVDTGLDGDHPDFAGRIAHTYSFSPSFDPLQDTSGHGTHVAGIAAGDGSASAGLYTGMAPGSSLLVGRAGTDDFQTSAILQAIDNFLLFAGAAPVAINLSLGLFVGPHDGTSAFETAIHSLAAGPAGSRRIIAVAAGNERTVDAHFHSTVSPFDSTPLDVSFVAGTTSVEVEIWADGGDEYSVTATMGTDSFTVPSGTAGTSPSGRISIGNKSSRPPNRATLISLTFRPPSRTDSAVIQLTRTRNGGTGTFDAYVDGFVGFFAPSTEAGTISEPANAENVISVGSYDTKKHPIGQPDPAEGISAFSSLGPTRDGRIRPDLAAPGSLLYSTRSAQAAYLPIEIVDDNYVIMQGTSMATAHVTGIASLVWQSNPSLTGAQMRERLRRTSDPPSDGSTAPNNTWGYGKVNAFRAVTEPVASITAPATANPGSQVQLTSENSSGPLGAAITAYQWSAPGASVTPSGSANTMFQADSPGDYTVSLVVTSGGIASSADSRTIHVNHLPAASISGPAAVDNVSSVAFSGTGTDEDNQSLSFRWVLVARPSGSSSVLTTANMDNVTLVPDLSGTYVLGLRVNDGLDDSALATHTITVGIVTGSGGGGGGGCAIGTRTDDGGSSLVSLLLILFPVLVLPSRKLGSRLRHRCRPAASKRN